MCECNPLSCFCLLGFFSRALRVNVFAHLFFHLLHFGFDITVQMPTNIAQKRARSTDNDTAAPDVLAPLKAAATALGAALGASVEGATTPSLLEQVPTRRSVATVVPRINAVGQQLLGTSIEVFVRSEDGKEEADRPLALFDIVEAEAYVIGPRHNDTFTHADPQQAVFGSFYFHRMGPGKAYKGGSFKGMDVTVGPLDKLPASNDATTEGSGAGAAKKKGISGHVKHTNGPAADGASGDAAGAASAAEWSLPSPFYAGMLIRSVRDAATGAVIEGPCLVVDALLAAAAKANASSAPLPIATLVEGTGRSFLRCDGTEEWLAGKTAADRKGLGLVGMRLVKNSRTAPTHSSAESGVAAAGNALPYDASAVPSHVLLAPRVGLIPRTVADLRYAGALYRYINARPTGAAADSEGGDDGANAAQKKKGSKASAAGADVRLAKVRAGIVAALAVQHALGPIPAGASASRPAFSEQQCAALTGATASSVASVARIVADLLPSKGGAPSAIGAAIVAGSAPAAGAEGAAAASAAFARVLAMDVKKAEIIAAVTALYGAYLRDGLVMESAE